MMADHAEYTFEPSVTFWEETAPVKLTLCICPPGFTGSWLDIQIYKGGISLVAPNALTNVNHSLPPMLHMQTRMPISDHSKIWGLSVLLRVPGIFTGITISPRSTLRQCPDHYTIRAGRNLPDKEFRYLRTVIVTADIHQGFISELRPKSNLHLTLGLVTCHTLYILLTS